MFKSFRFQTKLFVSYSMVVVIILAAALTAFYLYMSDILAERADENLRQLAARTSGQVDSLLTEMDRIALYIVSNPTILETFSSIPRHAQGDNYFYNSITDSSRISSTLVSISIPNSSSSRRISLYTKQGDYISTGIPDSAVTILEKTTSPDFEQWYGSITPKSDQRNISTPHSDFWSGDKSRKLLSLFRQIKDYDSNKAHAVVEVQESYPVLDALMNLGSVSGIQAYLITDSGVPAFPVDGEGIKTAEHYWKVISTGSKDNLTASNPVTGKPEVLQYTRSSFSGWTLVLAEPYELRTAPVQLFGRVLLFIGLCLLVLTLLAIFLITHQLTQPLTLLRNSVRKVSLDNLSLDIHHSGNSNEILQLNDAFESMFKRLKDSMDEVVQTRSQEIKAHMIALQSQMDPHFLYNMLAIISASSREAGAAEITEICQRLSSMLRYISHYQEDSSPIRNEIQHAVNYLELMKIRYEDQFEYSVDIAEGVYERKIDIPKLTLQPLVENCFQHGFKKVLPPWRLKIYAGLKEDTWYIEVTDNGAGFEQEKIDALYKRVADFIKSPSASIRDLTLGGMGLINTLVRLNLLYRDSMLLDIRSLPDGGTKITIGGKAV